MPSDTTVYHLPAKALDRLSDLTAGKLRAGITGDEAAQPAILLDTFDQSLRLSGRVLIAAPDLLELLDGAGQVLTQEVSVSGGLHADLPDGPVTDALGDLSPLRALLPMGQISLRRLTLTLLDNQGKTQARATLRILTPSEGGEGVILASVEAIRGYDKAHAALTDHIRESGAVALDERGIYARLFPKLSLYDPKPRIRIQPNEDAFDVACDLIDSLMPLVRANEAGIIADLDTEFLHDYRVVLRKVRSVLSLFKGVFDPEQTDELKQRFSAIMAPTGRLRDLDVYLLEREAFYDPLPEAMHSGLDQMFDMFSNERKEAQARLARHLRSKAYRSEITALTKLFQDRQRLLPGPNAARNAHELACELIWKRYRKICRIAEAITPETPAEEIHELRIHCKKLRYLMEFFAPAFPDDQISSLIKPLKKLQDVLGNFNDASVQQASLQDFVETLSNEPGHMDVAKSVGALTAVLHQRQMTERGKVVHSFQRFNSAETQQTFRELFRDQGEET